MDNPITVANAKLAKRYNSIIQNSSLDPTIKNRLISMGIHLIEHELLVDKQSRWLGFIQGVLFANNLIDINTERDISRKIFHKAYIELGIDIPDSIDLAIDPLTSDKDLIQAIYKDVI